MLLYRHKRPIQLPSLPPPTIFVSIASYRDSRCHATLKSLFHQATHPGSIYVGLCTQNDAQDPPCPASDICPLKCYGKHIRTIHLSHLDAKGPTHARQLCAQLYQGEDYYLQIDSHMEFVQGWDRKLLDQMEGAVLTQYPPAEMTEELKDGSITTHICDGSFQKDGMVSFVSVQTEAQPQPMPTYYLAAGFMFGPGSMLRKVPLDPHLSFLFWGEELLYACRLYTHGYDLFSPSVSVCSHVYGRQNEPSVFTDTAMPWGQHQKHAQNRVKVILGWPLHEKDQFIAKDIQRYGLGYARTMEQYMQDSGLDLAKKKVKNICVQ